MRHDVNLRQRSDRFSILKMKALYRPDSDFSEIRNEIDIVVEEGKKWLAMNYTDTTELESAS